MVKRKTGKSIAIGVILVALLFLGISLVGQSQSFSVVSGENIDSCVVDIDGSIACLRPSAGQPLAIFVSEPNARPGQDVDVDIEVSLGGFSEINSAKFILYDSSSRAINTWDFKNTFLAYYGCNAQMSCYDASAGQSRPFDGILSFKAPSDPGVYSISYKITGKSVSDGVVSSFATTLAQEQRQITVTRLLDTNCAADYCADWFVTDSFSGGKLYQRTCYESSFDVLGGVQCVDDVVATEYYTECDTGYHIKDNPGVTTTSGTKSCEPDAVTILTCYKCDGGLQSKSFDNQCGSGWSISNPGSCGVSNTDTTETVTQEPERTGIPAPVNNPEEVVEEENPVVIDSQPDIYNDLDGDGKVGFLIQGGDCVQVDDGDGDYSDMNDCVQELAAQKSVSTGTPYVAQETADGVSSQSIIIAAIVLVGAVALIFFLVRGKKR